MRFRRRPKKVVAAPGAANSRPDATTMMKPEMAKNRSTPAPQGSRCAGTNVPPCLAAATSASVWAWPTTTISAASARRLWMGSIWRKAARSGG